MNQKIRIEIAAGLIAAIAILLGMYFWMSSSQISTSVPSTNVDTRPAQKMCTQEAKQCSDGSYVSRTGPNCEFATCPEVKTDETANWQTYRNEEYGFEFKHPAGYEAKTGDLENSMDPEFFVKNPNKDFPKGPTTNYAFGLSIATNFLRPEPDMIKTPEEWLVNQKKMGGKFVVTSVDGVVAYAQDDIHGEDFIKDVTLFVKRDNAYDMYNFAIKKSDVGDKILATFKFTK